MTSLWSIIQGPSETLERYTEMFTTAYSCMTNSDEEFSIHAYIAGVVNESIRFTLCGNVVADMEALINKVHKLSDMQEIS